MNNLALRSPQPGSFVQRQSQELVQLSSHCHGDLHGATRLHPRRPFQHRGGGGESVAESGALGRWGDGEELVLENPIGLGVLCKVTSAFNAAN